MPWGWTLLDDPQILARLILIFRSEYQEYSVQLQDLFNHWEGSAPTQDSLHEAFRTAHNLKGAAGAIGLMPIAHLAHNFESLLQKLRSAERSFDPEVIDIGYAFLSQIEQWLGSPVVDWTAEADSEIDGWIETWLQGSAKPTSEGAHPRLREEGAGPEGVPALGRGGSPTGEAGFVRVAVPKLESILSDITELTLAQSRMRHRQSEVDEAFRQLQGMQKDWERLYSLQRKAARESGRKSLKLLEVLEHQRGQFRHFHSWFRAHRSQLLSDGQMLELSLEHLCEEAHGLHLVPLGQLFDGIERQVRDLARRLGKKVKLEVSGRETHLDRRLIEAIRDPLMHLIRNCMDHGLESEHERKAAGKSPIGKLSLSASQRGQRILLEVTDDGSGIDWAKVKERAEALGWLTDPTGDGGGECGPDKLANFIFRPGFSTCDVVTEVSGRGYGLDIVEASVEALHGRVDVSSLLGRGTTFRLTLPLTQATLHSLIVRCASRTYGIAIGEVERALRINPAMCERVGNSLALRDGSQLLPLMSLAQLLGAPADRPDSEWAIVISPGHTPVGLLVDQIMGEQELVVKSLGPLFASLAQYEGGAVMEDGQVVLLLNPLELLRGGRERLPRAPLHIGRPQPTRVKRKILVIDDSITSRTLEKSILENAGYDVVTCSNGEDGVRLARTADCQLVVSDVEMPRMDGFQLARHIKSDPATKHLRVVLVTSRASTEDRAKGLEVGADAYVVKGEFDETQFLEMVHHFLDGMEEPTQ